MEDKSALEQKLRDSVSKACDVHIAYWTDNKVSRNRPELTPYMNVLYDGDRLYKPQYRFATSIPGWESLTHLRVGSAEGTYQPRRLNNLLHHIVSTTKPTEVYPSYLYDEDSSDAQAELEFPFAWYDLDRSEDSEGLLKLTVYPNWGLARTCPDRSVAVSRKSPSTEPTPIKK